ncbi:MAG: 23S rRNA (pseudouridine(1915)-N(3))-methyltransferase RlmH [Albidovulum sp.]
MLTDYLRRFERSGRGLGLGPARIIEVEDKKSGGMRTEAALLERVIVPDAALMALDERGDPLSSPQFADLLADWRDHGRQELAVIIGGADGLDPALRNRADRLLSFGPMVWPHMLARVMLTEQLYRAASILAGAPYHRA